MKTYLIVGVVAVALFVGGVWWSSSLQEKELASGTSNLVAAAGLHWHPTVSIFVHGEEVQVPQNLGLAGVHNPIHTHDDMPVVHLEFGGRVEEDDIKLGRFFDVWGQPFSSEQVLDYKNGPEGKVRMFVNGEENFEFENYRMRDRDQIEIRFE